jgi:ketosteroid isomerase-like protein
LGEVERISQPNVVIAQRAIAAFNGGDVDAFAALTTHDFEWYPSMGAIEGQAFLGREGIAKYFGNLNQAWETFQIVPGGFRDLTDTVIMLGRLEGRGRESGVPVDAALGMVFDFRSGAISRIRGYLDHDDALKAAGLAE